VPTSLVWPGIEHGKCDPLRCTPAADGFEEGFQGFRDWECFFYVSKGSYIHPAFPYFMIRNEDLAANLQEFHCHAHNWALWKLYYWDTIDEITNRVFVALKWYGKSCRFSLADDEAIVFLAIALESLLNVRAGDGLSERFKDAVITMLGPVERLDSWLDQFYDARSKLVHRGAHPHFRFLPVDADALPKVRKGQIDPIPHRTLLEYGRRIFRMCLVTIVTGARLAEEGRLAVLLMPNTERLERICKTLNTVGKTDVERLIASSDLMRGLEHGRDPRGDPLENRVSLKQLAATAQLVLRALMESGILTPPDLHVELTEWAAHAGALTRDDLSKLEKLRAGLIDWRPEGIGAEAGIALSAAQHFLAYAADQTFLLRRFRLPAAAPPPPEVKS
jgi:hypothetical protein